MINFEQVNASWENPSSNLILRRVLVMKRVKSAWFRVIFISKEGDVQNGLESYHGIFNKRLGKLS